jgi:ATP-dependent protease HslVU (ClpYQ) peptidase subunit
MTCIVGIMHDDKVYLGGDSAASTMDGFTTKIRIPKVYQIDEYLIGYAGSFRMGKFIQYNIEFPKPPTWARGSEKLDEFINGYLVPHIRKCVKESDLDQNEKEDFEFIIGLRGHIFELDENWAAYESAEPYVAIGSGAQIALGSLYSTSNWSNPGKRIRVALEASERYNSYVSSPFTILER